MTHPMAQEWNRKEVTMAKYQRKTGHLQSLPIPRIRSTLPTTHRHRKQKRLQFNYQPSQSQFAEQLDLEPSSWDFQYSSDLIPLCKTRFSRPLIPWAHVAIWKHNRAENAIQEISRIPAASLADAQVFVMPKHNKNAISHFRIKTVCIIFVLFLPPSSKNIFVWQDYRS